MKKRIRSLSGVFFTGLLSAVISQPLSAAVPPAYGGASDAERAENPENLKKSETKIRKILTEMTAEQQRHQKKVEKIKEELLRVESDLEPRKEEKKNWVSPKVAMVLGEDLKGE